MNRVFEFIKNPYAMWEKGDLARRRLVLGLVFEKALVYKKDHGFEHPELSLPIAIACSTGRNFKSVVTMPYPIFIFGDGCGTFIPLMPKRLSQ